MSDYHKGRITYSMQLFCGLIPKPHDKLCKDLAFTYAKYIMDWIGARNARVVCHDFLLCRWIRQKGINKLLSFEHQLVPLLNYIIFLITEITFAYSLFRSRHRCAAQKRWLPTKYPPCLPAFFNWLDNRNNISTKICKKKQSCYCLVFQIVIYFQNWFTSSIVCICVVNISFGKQCVFINDILNRTEFKAPEMIY